MGSTLFLYIVTVLVWGSTWHLITLQLGHVPIELSVGYRFLLAGALLFLWLLIRRAPLKFTRQDHGFFILHGALIYSGSYWLLYKAAGLITSGMNAVIFSVIIVLNVFFAALFFKKSLTIKLVGGAFLGVIGISCIFLPDLFAFSVSYDHVLGLSLSVCAAFISSLGNMVVERHHNHSIPVAQINAYSMTYGGIFSLLYSHFILGDTFVFDVSFRYVSSLIYLTIMGSILTFGCYMVLIKRIGVDRAGYPLILIPLTSLVISSFTDGYRWSTIAVVGVVLIFLGNILVVSKTSWEKVRQTLEKKQL